MKLYEIPTEYAKAAHEYQTTLDEIEEMFRAGEIDEPEMMRRYDAAAEIYGEYLGFQAGEFDNKAEATAMVIRNLQADADVWAAMAKPFEEEAARYRNRQKAAERQAARLMAYVKGQMEAMGKDRVDGDCLKLGIQLNSSPTIFSTDLSAVPEGFLVPQPPKVNTELVRKHWKEYGQPIAGLEIQRGTHLRIR